MLAHMDLHNLTPRENELIELLTQAEERLKVLERSQGNWDLMKQYWRKQDQGRIEELEQMVRDLGGTP